MFFHALVKSPVEYSALMAKFSITVFSIFPIKPDVSGLNKHRAH